MQKSLQKDTNGVTLKSSNSVDRKLNLMMKELKRFGISIAGIV